MEQLKNTEIGEQKRDQKAKMKITIIRWSKSTMYSIGNWKVTVYM